MARPSKITPEIIELVSNAVLHGASYQSAARSGGIHYDTFNEWMKKGREAKSGIYREFSEALETANAQCEVNMVRVIQSAAAKGDWKAALEWLKRRRRNEWGDNVDVTSGGKTLEIGINPVDYRSGLTKTEE